MARRAGWSGLIGRAWLVPAAVLLVAACSETLYVDVPRLEEEIRLGIQGQAQLTVTDVVCPDERLAKQGDVFECTADIADGRQLTITVTQNGGPGNMLWRVTGGS